MYDTVLVPLDGSTFGEHAIPYAVAVAQRTGARIELLHVHELPVDAVGLVLDPESDEEVRERARRYLEKTAAAVEERTGVTAGVRLAVGHAVPAIKEEASKAGAGMIVMCTHGRGGLQRAWIGSVADGLVRESELPVLMVRPTNGKIDFGRAAALDEIVVALDGSATSERILPHAAALGLPESTHYTLLRVVPPEIVVGGHIFRIDRERARELEEKAEEYLQERVSVLEGHAAGVAVRVVGSESPVAAILEVAEEASADLIAMTTHGYGGLKRLLLGSIMDKVLRAADVPLLVYRPS